MTAVSTDDGNETKSDIFPWDIFLKSICFGRKILKYFNDFFNWHLKIKWDLCKSDSNLKVMVSQ